MAHPQHVTLVITHRLAPGNEQAYEAWLNRIMPDAAGFTGHLGVNVIRPSGDEQAYTVLVRFDNLDNLYRWITRRCASNTSKRSPRCCWRTTISRSAPAQSSGLPHPTPACASRPSGSSSSSPCW